MAIDSSVTECASLAPRHALKNSVVASLISMRARCTPRQTRAPNPNGEYTAFAASVILDTAPVSSKSSESCHREGSNLIFSLFSPRFEEKGQGSRTDLPFRISKEIGVSVQSECLSCYRCASGYVVSHHVCASLWHNTR